MEIAGAAYTICEMVGLVISDGCRTCADCISLSDAECDATCCVGLVRTEIGSRIGFFTSSSSTGISLTTANAAASCAWIRICSAC